MYMQMSLTRYVSVYSALFPEPSLSQYSTTWKRQIDILNFNFQAKDSLLSLREFKRPKLADPDRGRNRFGVEVGIACQVRFRNRDYYRNYVNIMRLTAKLHIAYGHHKLHGYVNQLNLTHRSCFVGLRYSVFCFILKAIFCINSGMTCKE